MPPRKHPLCHKRKFVCLLEEWTLGKDLGLAFVSVYRGLKIAYFGFCTTHLHPSESMAILQSQETRKVSGLLIPPVQGPCEFLQATMLLSRDSDEERKAKVKSITDIVYICSLVVYLVWFVCILREEQTSRKNTASSYSRPAQGETQPSNHLDELDLTPPPPSYCKQPHYTPESDLDLKNSA